MNRRPLARIWLAVLLWAGLAATAVADGYAPAIEVVAFGVAAGTAPDGIGEGDESPFFAASDSVGLPEELAIQVSDLFAEEIDFHRDLARGYLCTLVYEMYLPNGMPKAGRLLAARFTTPEANLEAFWFPVEGDTSTYYDPRGIDINKALRLVDPDKTPWVRTLPKSELVSAFRRSPLDFSRITSMPSRLRYHPILKEWRAHRGTDYGAPIGTRVRATAEGTVRFAGERGGYGKLVELRHFDRYTSRYGHLNAFAPGLSEGDTVTKGQVIGQVGMTGLATGPHLHYELHADPGANRPDKLVFAIRAVPPERMPEFKAAMADYRRKLAFAQRRNLIILK